MIPRILKGVEGSGKMLRKMKRNFLQLSKMVTSYLASIKQINNQLGQISSHLNTRKKGGLPSDTLENLNNDVHIMAIITKSGRNINNDVMNLDDDPNKRMVKENISRKRKQFDKSNAKVPTTNKPNVEKP